MNYGPKNLRSLLIKNMTIIKSDLKLIDIFSSINVALIGVMKHLKRKEKRDS